MYHNVMPPGSPIGFNEHSISISQREFVRHARILGMLFNILPVDEYARKLLVGKKGIRDIAITFDDGSSANFIGLWPVLEKLQIPVSIFVTTRHLNNGLLLWDYFLNALCFDSGYQKITFNDTTYGLSSASQRRSTKNALFRLGIDLNTQIEIQNVLSKNYPIPNHIIRFYEGMSSKQLRQAAKSRLILLGAHSVHHPNLSQLTAEEQFNEIRDSKRKIEEIIEDEVKMFAFPNGDYDSKTLKAIEKSGFDISFAVSTKNIGDSKYEIPRVGIFSSSIIKLLIKVFHQIFIGGSRK